MFFDQIASLRSAARRELRNFGFLVGVVLLTAGIYMAFRERAGWPWLVILGAALGILATVAPRFLKWPYAIWMTLGSLVGTIVSTALLALCFLLIVTPIALISRLAGKDFLSIQLRKQARSYWLYRDVATAKARSRREQQF